jgi:hypothetical protein
MAFDRRRGGARGVQQFVDVARRPRGCVGLTNSGADRERDP